MDEISRSDVDAVARAFDMAAMDGIVSADGETIDHDAIRSRRRFARRRARIAIRVLQQRGWHNRISWQR